MNLFLRRNSLKKPPCIRPRPAAINPAAIIIAVCSLAFNLPAGHCSPVTAYRFKQESSVDGKFEILASKLGVKIKSQKGGYEICSAAPDWQVYAVRPEAKELTHMTYAQWSKFYMPSFRMAGSAANLKTPSKTVVQQDVACKKYHYEFPGSGVTAVGWSGWSEKQTVIKYEVNTQDYLFPPQVSLIVSRYLNLPALNGIPVSFYTLQKKSGPPERGWLLRTISSTPEEVSGREAFQPPPRLKNCGEITSQFLSRGIQGLADDMSEMLEVKSK